MPIMQNIQYEDRDIEPIYAYGSSDFLYEMKNNEPDINALRNFQDELVNIRLNLSTTGIQHKQQPLILRDNNSVLEMSVVQRAGTNLRNYLAEELANFYGYFGTWYDTKTFNLNTFYEIRIKNYPDDIVIPFPSVELSINTGNAYINPSWQRCLSDGSTCSTIIGQAQFGSLSLPTFNFEIDLNVEVNLDSDGNEVAFKSFDYINVKNASITYRYNAINSVCNDNLCSIISNENVEHTIDWGDQAHTAAAMFTPLSNYLNLKRVKVAEIFSHDNAFNPITKTIDPVINNQGYIFLTGINFIDVDNFILEGIKFINNLVITDDDLNRTSKLIGHFFHIEYENGIVVNDTQYYNVFSSPYMSNEFLNTSKLDNQISNNINAGINITNVDYTVYSKLENLYFLNNRANSGDIITTEYNINKNRFGSNIDYSAFVGDGLTLSNNITAISISTVYTMFFFSTDAMRRRFTFIFVANNGKFYRTFNLLRTMDGTDYRIGFAPVLVDDEYWMDVHISQLESSSWVTKVYRVQLGFNLNELPNLEKPLEYVSIDKIQYNELVCYNENLGCNSPLTKL